MVLPFSPPVEPMLAKLAGELPEGNGWLYEPKWDGFRALAFRDGGELYLQSRELKPLNRYFPELEAPLLRELPERSVVDGEIVIAGKAGLEFEALLLRIHPAASRVKMLAEESPASYVAFDLLALAQERPGHDDRLAAAGPLRRRGHAAPRGHRLELHHGQAPRAGGRAGSSAGARDRGAPLARLGRRRGGRPAHARRLQPVEPR